MGPATRLSDGSAELCGCPFRACQVNGIGSQAWHETEVEGTHQAERHCNGEETQTRVATYQYVLLDTASDEIRLWKEARLPLSTVGEMLEARQEAVGNAFTSAAVTLRVTARSPVTSFVAVHAHSSQCTAFQLSNIS